MKAIGKGTWREARDTSLALEDGDVGKLRRKKLFQEHD